MIIYVPLIRRQKVAKIISEHKRCHGRDPDLKNPSTFNEKIQWLKLNYKNTRITKSADKATARNIVAEQIGKKYLIPILGIYDNTQEIDWERLPKEFVLKVSDGYGQNIICIDKDRFDIEEAIKKLDSWLKPTARNYWRNYEWQYKHNKPRILIEEYIGDKNNQIHEYKFMYLGGKLAFVVVEERSRENAKIFHQTIFDGNWEKLPITRVGHEPSGRHIPQPKTFSEMLKISRKLAQDFPICRVDLYEVGDEIKFGELTFTPANGWARYSPASWDLKLGKMIALPRRNNYTFLEWRPIEVYPRTWLKKGLQINRELTNVKLFIKRAVKAILPYGLVRAIKSHRLLQAQSAETVRLLDRDINRDYIWDIANKNGFGIRFGQSGEDAILQRIFKRKRGGFYIDVGCFHPTRYSNTYVLHELLGWRGINIDASSKAIEFFKEARPNDINIHTAIGKKRGKQKLHLYSDPAVSTLSQDNMKKTASKGLAHIVGEEMVKVAPLSDILDAHLPKNKHIDILDIDIEGYDIQALETNNWEKYRPSVILIEDFSIRNKGVIDSAEYKFMKDLGYKFFSHAYDTSIYVDSKRGLSI